jgi:protein NrfD
MTPDLVEVVSGRHNPMIDPTLHVWGWEIPVYLFLGGLVAGIMVLVPLLELRTGKPSRGLQHAPLVALILLSVGMTTLLLDLEYPTHVYRFYMTFEPTSPMSWGSWILILVYPALVLAWLGGMGQDLLDKLGRMPMQGLVQRVLALAAAHRRVILLTTVALGVGLGTYTGLLLGTMAARLQWNSAVLGPLFLTSGVSTGAALLMLMPSEDDRKRLLVRWDTLAIVVELGLILAMLLGFATGGAAGQYAAEALLGGPWTPWFWSVVVVAGLLVPLALNLVEITRHTKMTVAAPILILVGGFALRVVLVASGQVSNFSLLQ